MEKLFEILNKEEFTREDIVYLLSLNEDESKYLFAKANEVRRKYCGDDVFLRGIIEFSNYCEENCMYCGLREDNLKLPRYRMSAEEIIDTAKRIIKSGIRTIVMQSGEDSYYDTDMISYIVYQIKQISDEVAVTLCLGERRFDEYKAWKYAGADRYLLKHETANPHHYSIYHNGEHLQDRINHLRFLKNLGYQIGSGNMVGLPLQSFEDIADDILLCKELDCDMAAFGPFIPSPDTPYSQTKGGTVFLTLKTMAVARLVLKNAHIPATTALGSLDELGREKGLEAGGNVVMPNFTPPPYRENYVIYPNKRCIYDDPSACFSCLRLRIESIGRKVGIGRGDSFKRLKEFSE